MALTNYVINFGSNFTSELGNLLTLNVVWLLRKRQKIVNLLTTKKNLQKINLPENDKNHFYF